MMWPKVEVSFWFLALLACFLLLDESFWMLLMLCSVFLHELGHLAAFYWAGIPIDSIRLMPFGIEIRCRQQLCSYRKECLICLAGPSVNLLLAIAGGLAGERFAMFSAINAVIFGFNLLPVPPLDGGNLLQCVLREHCEPQHATVWQLCISTICLIPLCFWSLWLWRCSRNPSLLITCFYLGMKVVFQRPM